MARIAFVCTIGTALKEGRFSTSSGARAAHSVPAGLAAGTLTTNVAAAVAQLVTDAGSPTQGHVNTLNTAWGLLATAIAATSTATLAGDAVLDIDTAVITTQNGVRAAVRELLQTVAGSGMAP